MSARTCVCPCVHACWRPGQLQVAGAEEVVGRQEAAPQEVALEEVAGSHLRSLRREGERCRERE